MSTALPTRRNTPVAVTVALVALGALLVVLAIVYFVNTADALPGFLPGHEAGLSRHHTKHGLGALAAAALCWAGAWISTGRRPATDGTRPAQR